MKFSKFIPSIALFTLISCVPQGNIINTDLTDGIAPVGPGTGNQTSEVCNHQDASNYKPGTVKPGNFENCLFIICIDSTKMGFKIDKYNEYLDYIDVHGGALKNNDQLCGDSILKLPTQDVPFPSGYEAYHTYKEYLSEITDIVNNSQGLATLINIGKSDEGLPLIMVKVSNDAAKADTHPTLLVAGTHHAREHLSTETPLLILKNFVSKATTDTNLKNELKNKTVYFIPLVNPDGMIYDLQKGSFQFWRKNTRIAVPGSGQRGVDLNRNFDSQFGGAGTSDNPSSDVYHGPKAFSEPETQALRNFIQTHAKINFILTFHSFSELVLYPWGGKTEKIPTDDYNDIKFIADKLAGFTGYTPMQASALYVATGDLCDWAYGKQSKFCITIELTPTQNAGNNGFYPSGSVIQTVVNKNIPVVDYLFSIIENPKGVVP